jgi:hypothetical protein
MRREGRSLTMLRDTSERGTAPLTKAAAANVVPVLGSQQSSWFDCFMAAEKSGSTAAEAMVAAVAAEDLDV